MMKIKVFKSEKNDNWYFRIVAANGQTIAQSEGYKNRIDCLSTIESLQTKVRYAAVSQDGKLIL